jgi:hypothetical protein
MAVRGSGVALLLAIVALLPAPAWAWGQDGHVIVTRLAEAHLSLRAREALVPLLQGRRLPDVASWADDWRDIHGDTGPWHFVDIPRSADAYDATRDCHRGACVIEALERQVAILRDRTAPAGDRRRALRFIVHLVADLHQPMHAVTDDGAPGGSDRGGNNIKARLQIFQPEFPYHSAPTGNLHAIWDSDLIASAHRQQEAYVAALSRLPAPLARLQAGTFADWASQTHQVARDVAYRDLPPPDSSGVVQLSDDYAVRCRPVMELQLQRAGARLARVLNEAL